MPNDRNGQAVFIQKYGCDNQHSLRFQTGPRPPSSFLFTTLITKTTIMSGMPPNESTMNPNESKDLKENKDSKDSKEDKESKDVCSICRHEAGHNDGDASLESAIALTRCSHRFCLSCFRRSILTSSRCPNCRQEIERYTYIDERFIQVEATVPRRRLSWVDYHQNIHRPGRVSDDGRQFDGTRANVSPSSLGLGLLRIEDQVALPNNPPPVVAPAAAEASAVLLVDAHYDVTTGNAFDSMVQTMTDVRNRIAAAIANSHETFGENQVGPEDIVDVPDFDLYESKARLDRLDWQRRMVRLLADIDRVDVLYQETTLELFTLRALAVQRAQRERVRDEIARHQAEIDALNSQLPPNRRRRRSVVGNGGPPRRRRRN